MTTQTSASEQLFESPALEASIQAAVKAPFDKTFRPYDQDQQFLLPPSLKDWLPEEHLARFVNELVDEVLDLDPFLSAYSEARGYPPYDPRLIGRTPITKPSGSVQRGLSTYPRRLSASATATHATPSARFSATRDVHRRWN
jgi:hypothetical protein